MALRVPFGSLLATRHPACAGRLSLATARGRGLWIAAACALACAWLQAPAAWAQHGGHAGSAHPGVGVHVGGAARVVPPRVVPPRILIPPAPRVPISRPPLIFEQSAGFNQHFGGLGQHPIFIHHRFFGPAPFFGFGQVLPPLWWLNCSALWSWEYGCVNAYFPEYRLENYVAPPLVIYQSPVYVYYSGDHDLVLLFLKDGTAYAVVDYWFVGNQVHFITQEDGGAKIVEQAMGMDELDLQRTIDVNTRRGFRVVKRDEPLEQYLRDHPEANPPLLEPPPKN